MVRDKHRPAINRVVIIKGRVLRGTERVLPTQQRSDIQLEIILKGERKASTVGLGSEVVVAKSAARNNPRAHKTFNINCTLFAQAKEIEKVRQDRRKC